MVMLMKRGEIPVPIPNTAVKPALVDDTGCFTAGKVDWCHLRYALSYSYRLGRYAKICSLTV